MKNIKYILGAILFSAVFALFGVSSALAKTITTGDLTIGYAGDGALFGATNMAPGNTVVKTVTVTNTGTEVHGFSIATTNLKGDLAKFLIIETRNQGGSVIWSKKLIDIKQSPDSEIVIASLSAGETRKVDFVAYFPSESDNAEMGLDSSFDLVMGVEGPTESSSSSSLSLILSSSSSSAGSSVSSSNINGSTSSSSSESSSSESVSSISESSSSTGAFADVLGVEDLNRSVCPWWWILSIVYAFFLILLGIFVRQTKKRIVLLWPAAVGGVLYAAHWMMHDWWTPSKYCDWFPLIELVLLMIYVLAFAMYRKWHRRVLYWMGLRDVGKTK